MHAFEYVVMLSTMLFLHRHIMYFFSTRFLLTLTHKNIVNQNSWVTDVKRRYCNRIKWSEFNKLLSDAQLRRYFWIGRLCFQKLCDEIEQAVGEEVFISENFLKTLSQTCVYKSARLCMNLMSLPQAFLLVAK